MPIYEYVPTLTLVHKQINMMYATTILIRLISIVGNIQGDMEIGAGFRCYISYATDFKLVQGW